MEPLPHDISEKIVQCFGRCFHYKDGVIAFLVSAGLDRTLAERHSHLAKFVWGRQLLLELAGTKEGCVLQRKILTALCNLRDISDKDVKDRDAAVAALRDLKQSALDRHLVKQRVQEDEMQRRKQGEARVKLTQERSQKLQTLRVRFGQTFAEVNRQKAGYELEAILKELFLLSEIEYTPSYRTDTAQIDGHFRFEGFDYLVEARWRNEPPTQKEIGGFKDDVSRKLQSTRGLFVSVAGFSPEVIAHFNEPGSRIILMDGEHLTHVFEGRMGLQEGLSFLIECAATKGVVYSRFAL